MPNTNETITTLHDLLDYDARHFLSAEVQLKNVLPDWIRAAGSLKLKSVLSKYKDHIDQHIIKMNKFFEEEKISSATVTNRIMKAFIEETEEKVKRSTDVQVQDAGMLECVQQINHFKISVYGTATAYSKALGMEKYATIFHESAVNEKQIDDRLSQLAESEINVIAKSPVLIEP